MKKIILSLVVTAFSFCVFAQNQDSLWFENNYYKKEVMIPMRDGIKLFTSLYIPKDTTEKHPFLMTRTPYSCRPYGEAAKAQLWRNPTIMDYLKENYILVTQDVRGRYMSEGSFMDVRPFNKNKKGVEIDEASDSYDAVDWMIKNIPYNNGKFGVRGTSYPGFYSSMAAASGHPAIVAVSPQAPVTDWFMGDDFHHNGVFFMMDGFSFYDVFGKPRPVPTQDYGRGFETEIKDNYKFYLQAGPLKNLARMIGDSISFWHEMYKHPNYDDWWKARNARNALYNLKPAVLWVGGLFDAEDCFGAWYSYKAAEKQSPQTNNRIVMGPWSHGQWGRELGYSLGNIQFGSKTSNWFTNNIEFPFFQYHLKGKGSDKNIAEANIFFTGENEWKQLSQWPPADVHQRTLYLNSMGKLSFDSPKQTGFYDYISDPAHPVPYTEDVHEQRTKEYMTDDQRFASRRPDVLTFVMDIDQDVTIAGPIIADLATAISTTDADFVVKIIDVFPDNFTYQKGQSPNTQVGRARTTIYPMGGYQMLVRGEIMRGKYRKSFENPIPFVPNKIDRVKFELPDIAHTFKKGHQLMIQIQSSWFPLADMNPQKFVNIYEASEKDFQKANIKLFYGGANNTKFILPIMK